LNVPVAVSDPAVVFVAPTKLEDVPQRKPTVTEDALPRLARFPFSWAAVVVIPVAATELTLGGVGGAEVVKLKMELATNPSPFAHAWKKYVVLAVSPEREVVNPPTEVCVVTVTFVAPTSVADVPQRNPTATLDALPRSVVAPCRAAAVAVTPVAADAPTVGGVTLATKLRIVPVANPSPFAQASK